MKTRTASFRRILTGSIAASIAALVFAPSPAAHAASATWSATPADALWSTTGNWSASPVPGVGDTATFGASTVTTINTGDISLTQIAITATTAYTIGTSPGTGSITFADGTTTALNNSGQTNTTINANIILGTAIASNTTFTSGTNRTTTLAGSITGGTGGTAAAKTLTLAPASFASSVVTVSGAISDGGATSLALSKGGIGTVNLTNANNSFTGGLSVQTGTVNVSSLGALGSATTGLITLGTGNQAAGTLNFTGSPGSLSRQVQIGSSGGTGGATINNNATNGSSPLIFTNALFNAQTNNASPGTVRVLTLGGANTDANEIQGVIRNNTGVGPTVAVTKADAGTWILSGNNTYTGNTSINGGTLIAANANALGTGGTRNVSVAAGAALNYAAVANSSLSITGTLGVTAGGAGAGTVIGGSIGSSLAGAQIEVAGAATITDAAHRVNIYGVNGVTTGTTGTYTLITGSVVGSSLNPVTVPTLGTVFNNTNFTINTTGGDGGTSPFVRTANTLGIAITNAPTPLSSAFYIGGLSGNANVWAASNGSTASNFSASSGGAAQALVPGSAAAVTVDNNSFATSTVLGADMAINSLTISDNSSNFALNADGYTLTIGSGGITKSNSTTKTATIGSNLVLGAAQTWSNSDTGNALVVSGIVTGANNLLVTGAGNTTVSGRLTTGTGTLTKSGLGTLTLTNSNTYTGPTAVTGGTLEISGSISASTQVNVSGGTLLLSGAGGTNNKLNSTTPATVALNGGALDLRGITTTSLDQTVGALSLSGSSSIDFGSLAGGNTFRFADSHLQTWTGATLSIYDWTPNNDHLFFGGNDNLGLTNTQLSQITFYGSSDNSNPLGTATFIGNGELAAVPEPSSLALVAGVLGLVGYRERRRWARSARSGSGL